MTFREENIGNYVFNGRNGEYKVVNKFPEGGLGIVFLAEEINSGKHCVIKALKPEVQQIDKGDKLVNLFSREIKILRESKHPNMVKYIDDFEDEAEYFTTDWKKRTRKMLFLVMEYIKGRNLDEVGIPSEENAVVDWLITTCDVLDHNHQHEIYHRDIKPKNIMLEDATNKIFVIDYGIARNNDSTGGTEVFTPGFASPEQVVGEVIDNRTDIYSLGCTAYWLLTGKHYFDPIKKERSLCTRDLPPDQISTDPNIRTIDQKLNTIITTAVKENRINRYWHILDMKLRLESLRDSSILERPEKSAKLVNTNTGENSPIMRVVTQLGRKNPNCYNDVSIEDSTLDSSFNGGKYYNDMYISKQHARIIMKKKRYHLQDTYSTNGTYLNDKILAGTELKGLHDGDYIKLGPLELKNTGSFTFILVDAPNQ
ncbi:MAG: Serine/threonine-protein kinase PknD [Candidatus Argoarchaeum ethanivorans]|uniref:non-specific serine/threonine protein kinase n=1 Tax=Candidatus Argoarchaeum ethanivorans TaxID=2608793 RepID=A0A811TCA9_9EURY|nr:MAG: Serine/threonine-protein kinase PknD [Candidatus Argoarchaeum ethanivorans]